MRPRSGAGLDRTTCPARKYTRSPMRLDQLIRGVPAAAANVEITDLCYDNRLVTPGALFFCVVGFTRDGHEFAADAVARGVAALVVERPLDLEVPQVQVPS